MEFDYNVNTLILIKLFTGATSYKSYFIVEIIIRTDACKENAKNSRYYVYYTYH